MVVKAEAEKKNARGSVRWVFIIFIVIMVLILYYNFSGTIDTFQYLTLLFTVCFLFVSSLSLITAGRQLGVSRLQESAARESILASRDSIRSAVAPNIIFRIRPANDYWKDGRPQAGWEPGVGIYIENFGLGPAMNIRLSVKAEGEKERQTCEAEFIRLLVGQKYVLPSKQFPQLSVNKNHDRIIIDPIEYEDIRNPPNHYRGKEPETLELGPEDFDESERDKIEVGSTELRQVRNIIEVLKFLGKQERTDTGEAWISGEDIQNETGLSPFEINDAIENAKRDSLVIIQNPPPNYKPWKFISATITSNGRLWLEMKIASYGTDAVKVPSEKMPKGEPLTRQDD